MLRPLPPVGTIVHFFHHANKKEDPIGGLVSQCNEDGVLCINLINRGGGEVETVKGVRHLDDPVVAGNPEYARNNGGWDYHPWCRPPLPRTAHTENEPQEDARHNKEAKPCEIVTEAEKHRVLELREKGKSSTEISNEMGGTWNYQRVNAVIRNMGRQPA